jgi:DNA polymerase-3 subunit alpha
MKVPSKFVGLHGHSGFSPFDGLGYPDEHFKFCIENGLDGHAITEHGNFNSYAHAQLWVEKWNSQNKTGFKYIPGIEAYFHPSLKQWEEDKSLADQAASDKKARKKIKDVESQFQTKLIAKTDQDDEIDEIEVSNSLTIENEDETKSNKLFNPVNRRHHLVLLPKNQKGLLALFHACSKSYMEGFYRFPRMDLKMLQEACQTGDVIGLSACLGGLPSWYVFQQLQKISFDNLNQELLDDPIILDKCVNAVANSYDMMAGVIGRDNYFLELQFNKLPAQNLVNRAILEFAKRSNLNDKLVVTCDSHYHHPDLWKERELYKKLGYLNYKSYDPDSLPKSKDELKCELYPKNAQQVWEEYQKQKSVTGFYEDSIIRDAIERSYEIAHNMIGTVEPDRTTKFPNRLLLPPETTSFHHLVSLCKEGLQKRGLSDKPEYIVRLKEELEVIKIMKNADYFISYKKIMELARNVTLVGPGRGSGGGSLINYVLYITDLDPIFWKLPFSRFLSVYRKGAPDIDTDISDRDKVLDQLRDFFGFENVVPISNYNTFKLKTLIKDISKFYGISFEEVNNATKTVEQDVKDATFKVGDDKNLFVLTYDDAYQHSKSFKDFIDSHPHVAESVKVLFKQNRSLGRHAGGVLIADELPKKMPLIVSGGEPQSPWVEGVNFKHLEYIGNFIKYDLLGLETLRLIERTIELILKKNGNKNPSFSDVKEWFDTHLAANVIDFNDPRPYDVYSEGRFAGIFQLTSPGAQKLFVRAKPKNIIDIAALTSIYRPGPLAANVDKLWMKHEEDGFDWGHPLINNTLKETRGLLVFQESVMELANKVSGFPLAECDEIRRAIMKRDMSASSDQAKKTRELEDTIVAGAVKNGVPESVARKMYETICFMSGYGFNRAHAVAYAIDSFWCAWLLTYYEEEWICAYIESMSNSPEARAKAFAEVKSLGYKIVPIDINYATSEWTVLPGKRLMPSITSLKGAGSSAVEEIIQNRPYQTIEDLFWDSELQWKHSKFNKKALDVLIKAQAFESMNIVGKGKLFDSYHHMHKVIMGEHVESQTRVRKGEIEKFESNINHYELIKKSPKKDPHYGKDMMYNLIEKYAGIPEWTLAEQADNMSEIFGTVDVLTLVNDSIYDIFQRKNIKSVDDIEMGENCVAWFVIMPTSPKKGAKPIVGSKKKTKNGKEYVQVYAAGPTGKPFRLSIWGQSQLPEPYTLWCAEVSMNEYGYSTANFKMKKIMA